MANKTAGVPISLGMSLLHNIDPHFTDTSTSVLSRQTPATRSPRVPFTRFSAAEVLGRNHVRFPDVGFVASIMAKETDFSRSTYESYVVESSVSSDMASTRVPQPEEAKQDRQQRVLNTGTEERLRGDLLRESWNGWNECIIRKTFVGMVVGLLGLYWLWRRYGRVY
ncbi:Hypothetical protein D9617_2g053640 [Elsinoe fawcettii]|nr:Hypothetical protein D9617_2g053640 [Elsinoe fawcettii]